MEQWKASKWALWLIIAVALGGLGTWIFGHYTIGGLAQLIGSGISGGVIGVVSMIRSETIRWQDSHIRRVDNTIKAIDFYNEKVRELILDFMRQFDAATIKVFGSQSNRKVSKPIVQIELDIAIAIKIAKVLHRLDQLGWLMRQSGYLNVDELFFATASELAKFLLDARYQRVIQATMQHSSLRNLDFLIDKLQEAQDHGRI